MKQYRLPMNTRPKREKPTIPAQRKAMEDAQLGLARIILQNPAKYAGLQVVWAKAFVAKHTTGTLECK